ncbi:SRPBCC family protein [Streptomyces sp. NK08204]|uniref:aromatase/cyclase n=1 Tax=Streptomyces sp. NK08204 TaxID=2873260 RepID=UPI001CEC3AC6|nr:SRPBCC family protein [Streptomyces sp. NK08204]
MSVARVHRVVSEVATSAPAAVLYGLMADATQWPLFFQHCVHVERLAFDGTHERVRMWAMTDDRLSSWVSSRELDMDSQRVTFRQDHTDTPVESLSGVCSVRPLGDRSQVVLECSFTVTGDAPADVAWAKRVVRTHSHAQLDRLVWLAERWLRLDDLVLSFEDTVRFQGSADAAFDFLYRADDWPSDLPHVRSVRLVESMPGVQVMAMDGLTGDGSANHTESVRICFPGAGRLVHKETVTSALLSAHTGEWSIEPDASGVSLTARHHVLLREDAIAGVLGERATLAEARGYVRDELSLHTHLALEQAVRCAAGVVRAL